MGRRRDGISVEFDRTFLFVGRTWTDGTDVDGRAEDGTDGQRTGRTGRTDRGRDGRGRTGRTWTDGQRTGRTGRTGRTRTDGTDWTEWTRIQNIFVRGQIAGFVQTFCLFGNPCWGRQSGHN